MTDNIFWAYVLSFNEGVGSEVAVRDEIEPFLDPKYENGTSPTGTKAIHFSNSRGHLVLSPDYNTFFAGEEDVKRLCSYTIDALKRLISGDGRVVRDYLR